MPSKGEKGVLDAVKLEIDVDELASSARTSTQEIGRFRQYPSAYCKARLREQVEALGVNSGRACRSRMSLNTMAAIVH